MKYKVISVLRSQFSLSMLCKIAHVSLSGYFKWLHRKPKNATKEKLVIHEFNLCQKKQGVIQLKQTILREYGIIMNHKAIRRIMHENALECPIRRKKVARKGIENMIIKENILNRNFHPEEANKVLTTDFTYFNVRGITYYLSVVLDLFDNYPLVWYLSDNSDKSLSLNTIDLLEKKIDLNGCLIHSDQGIQYTCKAYSERLEKLNVIQSMSRRGNCWDNVMIEKFFGIIKTETIYLQPNRTHTKESLTEMLTEEFDYYINKRPQKSLGGIPPRDYREHHCST